MDSAPGAFVLPTLDPHGNDEMKNVKTWLLNGRVGLALALALSACSDESSDADGGQAGSGGTPPKIQEARSNLSHDTTPDVTGGDYEAFVSSTNDFGLDVFAQLAEGDTNVVFSPVSVAVALGMTYAGARNDTATQMAAVMHDALPDDTFHAANNQLAIDLASRNIAPHETLDGDKSVRLSLVNANWAQDGYPIEQPFLDVLAEDYDAGLKLLDFIGDAEGARQTINDWVAFQTEDKIRDLIGPGVLTTDTRLVLSNALYFYATWDEVFNAETTSEDTFSTLSGAEVSVDMMHETSVYAYAEGDGYQLVDLPYDGGEIAFTVLLPEAGRFSEIRGLLSDDWLTQARSSIADTEVYLTLPKFSFTWGTQSLKEPLITLGMVDAFQFESADFTGINSSGMLYISDVLHQAFIAIDESGTEAAAATAVVATGSAPLSPVVFSADRPFFFFIRDRTGLVLFAGQLTDPTA